VIDAVDLDTPASEQAHGFRADQTTQPEFEGRLGRETRAGWFSYELAVAADTPVALVALYRGSEGRRRVFDVLVDGTSIATETLPYHPTEWLERTYPIPEALTRGTQRVTVRFQPAAGALTASVFEVRVVHPSTATMPTQAPASNDVERLSWLSGCWAQPRVNGLVEEQWMTPRGGSMLGMSRTVIGGKTVEYEFLRITVVGSALAYVAKPSGQAEATFPVKAIEDGAVVFENLAHDFPQRIIYRRTAEGAVTARIEGTVNGETRGRDFPYTRCSP
jgi:hypothetical protein